MIRARNDEPKISFAEQESTLWSAYEEYMHGERDLDSLEQIEECDNVSLLDTSSNGLMDNFLSFVGGLFR